MAVVLRSNPSLTRFYPQAAFSPILLSVHADGAAHGGLLTHLTGYTLKCLCLKFVEQARRKTRVTAYFPCTAPQQLAMAYYSHTSLCAQLESKFARWQMKMSNKKSCSESSKTREEVLDPQVNFCSPGWMASCVSWRRGWFSKKARSRHGLKDPLSPPFSLQE